MVGERVQPPGVGIDGGEAEIKRIRSGAAKNVEDAPPGDPLLQLVEWDQPKFQISGELTPLHLDAHQVVQFLLSLLGLGHGPV